MCPAGGERREKGQKRKRNGMYESQEVEQRLARIEEAQEQELEQIGAQLRELSLVSFWSVM